MRNVFKKFHMKPIEPVSTRVPSHPEVMLQAQICQDSLSVIVKQKKLG